MPPTKRARSASADATPAKVSSPAAAAAAKAAEAKAAQSPRAATPGKAAKTPAKATPAKATPAKASASPSKKAAVTPAVDPDLPMYPNGVVYHLACTAADIADKFIFVGDPGRVDVVASEFDKGSVTFSGSHREINIKTGKYHGVPVTVLSTGMGTDNIEIIINEIHALKEYDIKSHTWQTDKERKPANVHIIRVGTCGCPRPDVPVGTLAVTHHAIGMDNTSRYYDAPAVNATASVKALQAAVDKTTLGKLHPYTTKANEDIVNSIVKATETFNSKLKKGQQAQSYIVGATASGSGFYGCQGRAVGKFRGHLTVPNLVDELGSIEFVVDAKKKTTEKVVNIEMENSALCYLTNFLGYKAGTVCAIIARRAGELREFAPDDVAKAAIANAITIGLEALISVE